MGERGSFGSRLGETAEKGERVLLRQRQRVTFLLSFSFLTFYFSYFSYIEIGERARFARPLEADAIPSFKGRETIVAEFLISVRRDVRVRYQDVSRLFRKRRIVLHRAIGNEASRSAYRFQRHFL